MAGGCASPPSDHESGWRVLPIKKLALPAYRSKKRDRCRQCADRSGQVGSMYPKKLVKSKHDYRLKRMQNPGPVGLAHG